MLWIFNGMILLGEIPSTWRKTCPIATLSTTNPTLSGLGLNLCIRTSKPETNNLEHEMASLLQCMQACTHIRTYACAYLCMNAYLHAVASVIVSSYVLFPLQAPFIKSACTELIALRDNKNRQILKMFVLL